MVRPGLDRELPTAELRRLERSLPRIVAQVPEGSLGPLRCSFTAVPDDRLEHVTSVAEDVCRHGDVVALDRLGPVAPAVHCRGDVLYEDVTSVQIRCRDRL